MSKDNFNWKSLFINDSSEETPKKEEGVTPSTNQTADTTRFPTSAGATNPTTVPGSSMANPYINEIVDVYEKGFNSLNLADFDFFELYKSVIAVGATNPQSYQMAFAMGKSLRSDLSKAFLLEKSRYYIDEIQKVHAKYDATGNARKNELDISITRDKVNLSKSISDLETQIQGLQQQLDVQKMELSKIDTDSRSQYVEIQLKIEANNFAKQKIMDSINTVVSGINQYL